MRGACKGFPAKADTPLPRTRIGVYNYHPQVYRSLDGCLWLFKASEGLPSPLHDMRGKLFPNARFWSDKPCYIMRFSREGHQPREKGTSFVMLPENHRGFTWGWSKPYLILRWTNGGRASVIKPSPWPHRATLQLACSTWQKNGGRGGIAASSLLVFTFSYAQVCVWAKPTRGRLATLHHRSLT